MNMSGLIDGIAEKSLRSAKPGDYMGEDDMLLHCGKCGEPMEILLTFGGKAHIVGIMCRCEREAERAEKADFEKRQALARAEQIRSSGIQDKALRGVRFDNSIEDKNLLKVRRYVEHWDTVRDNGTGLLMFGGTGTGKTHAAACAVNYLIDKGVPCMMTSFPRILGSGLDKMSIVKDMRNYELVVVDDLGAERQSDYALEVVFLIVDEWYKSGKPMIVTTNLTQRELQHPEGVTHERIYQRIQEVCVPINFGGSNKREAIQKSRLELAKKIMNE